MLASCRIKTYNAAALPSRYYKISVMYNNLEFIRHRSARCITISSPTRNSDEWSKLIWHVDFDFVSFIMGYRVTNFTSVSSTGTVSCTNSRILLGIIIRYPFEWSLPARANTGISKLICRWCRTYMKCSRKPKGQIKKSSYSCRLAAWSLLGEEGGEGGRNG
jgi:hypothetical protein